MSYVHKLDQLVWGKSIQIDRVNKAVHLRSEKHIEQKEVSNRNTWRCDWEIGIGN